MQSNLRFPNFNFDNWLKAYILIDLAILGEDSTPNQTDEQIYTDLKELYDNQVHMCHSEEYWCAACEFKKYIDNFTEFMIILQSEPTVKMGLVIEHFMKRINYGLYRNESKVQVLSHQLLRILKIDYDGTTKIHI